MSPTTYTKSTLYLVHVTRSFFFFQAEDGIRDLTVTGVQTCALPISAGATRAERPSLRVGSKSFTESYILAEIVAQIIDDTGEARAERRLGLGGSGVVHRAPASGHIDVYPEDTGPIPPAILQEASLLLLDAMRGPLGTRRLLPRPPRRPPRAPPAPRALSTDVGGPRAPARRPHRHRDNVAPQRPRGSRAAIVRRGRRELPRAIDRRHRAAAGPRAGEADPRAPAARRRLAERGGAARGPARHPRRAPPPAGPGGADGRRRAPRHPRARRALPP